MRIGIDVRCLAEGKHTGVEEYTIALLQDLFRLDHKNEYILFFNAWKRTAPDFQWATQHPHVTLKTFHFPNKLLNMALWYVRFPKLDRLLGGVDVFFLPNLNFVALSARTKLVVTAHDLSFELFPETFSWKRRFWHFLIDFRRLVRRADQVIAVSQSTKDDVITYYAIASEKVSVIPSGIDNRFHPMSRNDTELVRVQEKYHLPYRCILALATLEPRKNIIALLRSYEALRRLNNPVLDKYALVIAGTPGWKDKEILQEIEQSPYRKNIVLPGFIADADKTALYNLASVFVYPSLYEGFGFPPLEAMACGVPVIASHSSSLPEVVGDAGVLIDPYQPDELLQALQQVLLFPEFGETLRQRGINRAKLFSWKKSAQATLHIFQHLIIHK